MCDACSLYGGRVWCSSHWVSLIEREAESYRGGLIEVFNMTKETDWRERNYKNPEGYDIRVCNSEGCTNSPVFCDIHVDHHSLWEKGYEKGEEKARAEERERIKKIKKSFVCECAYNLVGTRKIICDPCSIIEAVIGEEKDSGEGE